MAADAPTANHNHERMAEFVEALGSEKYPVAGELLEDQLIVKVAGLRASGEGLGPKVFFVGGRNCPEARQLSRRRMLLVISALVSYTESSKRSQPACLL